jgi:hypothetical protein
MFDGSVVHPDPDADFFKRVIDPDLDPDQMSLGPQHS